jgi:hypothetical protein
MVDAYWSLGSGFVNSNDPERMRAVLSVVTTYLRECGHARSANRLDEKVLADDEVTALR